MKNEEIIAALKHRYATKVYDSTKLVSDEDLRTVLESGRLAPSVHGIEPWKFIVVQNPEMRAKLRTVSFDQPKVTDAAILIVIAYRTDVEERMADELIERTAHVTGQPKETFAGLHESITRTVALRKQAGDLLAWARAQAYIPLGMMIETASLLGIDTGPMEGFIPDQVDEILHLKEQNLHATSMLALGYRGEDPAAERPKVRRAFDEVVEFIA